MVLLLFIVDEQPKVSHNDKAMVRDHILVFLVQVPPLLRYNCVISTVLLMILIFTFWEFSLSLLNCNFLPLISVLLDKYDLLNFYFLNCQNSTFFVECVLEFSGPL